MPFGISSAWWTLITITFGSMIGVAGSILGGLLSNWFQHQEERQRLQGSLIVELRSFESDFDSIYAITFNILYPNEESPGGFSLGMKVTYGESSKQQLHESLSNFNFKNRSEMIFTANLDKIGRLEPEVAKQVIEFYEGYIVLKNQIENGSYQDVELGSQEYREEIQSIFNLMSVQKDSWKDALEALGETVEGYEDKKHGYEFYVEQKKKKKDGSKEASKSHQEPELHGKE